MDLEEHKTHKEVDDCPPSYIPNSLGVGTTMYIYIPIIIIASIIILLFVIILLFLCFIITAYIIMIIMLHYITLYVVYV